MKKRFLALVVVTFVTACRANEVVEVSFDSNISSLLASTEVDKPESVALSEVDYSEETTVSEVSDVSLEESEEITADEEPLYEIQIEDGANTLATLREQSQENETYCFFTDPHCFLPTRDYSIDTDVLKSDFDILKKAYDLSSSSFIVCGGDLLNNGDTKSQACYKLSYFSALMKTYFNNSYFIVGNHDTNYQGDTYMDSHDANGCILSQSTINDILYDGGNSYYCIDAPTTSFYCFDSGIDWYSHAITAYQEEQISWFANSLANDLKPHKAVFIHIASFNSAISQTPMMLELDRVINAFNHKNSINLGGQEYDYSNANGLVYFFHAGHDHRDLNGFTPSGIPVFLTRSFSSPEIATQPTFDIVFVDYTNLRVVFLRIGDGYDRELSIDI